MKTILKTILPIAGICIFAVACQKEDVPPSNVLPHVDNRTPTATVPNIDPVGAPDLVVSLLTTNLPIQISPCDPTTPMPDATCTTPTTGGSITIRVTNIGNAPAAGGFDIQVGLPGGSSVTRFVQQTLAPGASATRVISGFNFSDCQGTSFIGTLIGTADIFDDIAEIREGNNVSRPYTYCTNQTLP